MEGHELWLLTTCRVAALVHVLYIHLQCFRVVSLPILCGATGSERQVSCLRSCGE